MYCVIRYSESKGECNENYSLKNTPQIKSDTVIGENKELLINPNCYIKILIEYIANQIDLATNCFDLCDENGQLKKIKTHPPNMYATNILKYKETYYIVVCECNSQNFFFCLTSCSIIIINVR